MKTIVVYDSWYHNTEKIAKAIAEGCGKGTVVADLQDNWSPDLKNAGLVIIGSPTHGGVATPVMQDYLKKLKDDSLEGIAVATFDTRVPSHWVKLIGFAAHRMSKAVERKGATVIGSEGFIVEGKEGPLKAGELQRAESWGRSLKDHAPLVAKTGATA